MATVHIAIALCTTSALLVCVLVSILFILLSARISRESLAALLGTPLLLVAVTRSFGLGWRAAVVWSLVGALIVHLAFYKLLRVPLPWGVLQPIAW